VDGVIVNGSDLCGVMVGVVYSNVIDRAVVHRSGENNDYAIIIYLLNSRCVKMIYLFMNWCFFELAE
jgi:hypothetical protein